MPEYEVRNDILQTTARALYEFRPALLKRIALQDKEGGRFYPEDATSKLNLSEADLAEIVVELKSVEALFGKEMFFGRLTIGSATTAWRSLIANFGVVFSMDPYSVFGDVFLPVELILPVVTFLAVIMFGIYVGTRK